MSRLVIGTRGSKLAVWQANWVRDSLSGLCPQTDIEVRVIRTQGDRLPSQPFDQMPGKGFFVKETEEALLDGSIDLAVHSMKDLPSELPQGLGLAAIPRREDPRDVLVSADGAVLADLPEGARVGTGAPRRAAQLLSRRPDLRIQPLRGNIDTRVRKLREGDMEAIVLAAAGLNRLGIDVPRALLDPEESLPAVGQGALGIETRTDDAAAREAAALLDDVGTARAVSAERAFLAALGGGCQVPIAALAEVDDSTLRIRGMVAVPDGSRILRLTAEAGVDDAESLGRDLGELFLERGAADLLARPVGGAPR